MYKCLFYDVYSSEEEEIEDVNSLQEEFSDESTSTILDTDNENAESDKSDEFNENNEFGLEIGDEFEDWDLVEKQVDAHAMKFGFEVVKRRLERDKHGNI